MTRSSAIVLTGAGKAFSGGADIKEFGSSKSLQEPDLLSVIAALENASKPVVAALHTVVMGGGLELALRCHCRIAAPGCSVAQPEVKLGLIRGAGGTRRLPRVIGVEPGLNMIVSGEPVKSEMLAMLPGQKLYDSMAGSADSLMAEAMAFANEMTAVRPLPLVRNLPCKHPLVDAYFKFARIMVSGMSKNFPASIQPGFGSWTRPSVPLPAIMGRRDNAAHFCAQGGATHPGWLAAVQSGA